MTADSAQVSQTIGLNYIVVNMIDKGIVIAPILGAYLSTKTVFFPENEESVPVSYDTIYNCYYDDSKNLTKNTMWLQYTGCAYWFEVSQLSREDNENMFFF